VKYELTLKMTLKSRSDVDRVTRQIESLFEYGTIRESIAFGLDLDDDPHLVDVSVRRARPLRRPALQAG
jgi:hypothetical protein